MAKKDSDSPLNFWSILVYVWIFCVYVILFKIIGEVILFIIDMSPFKDFKDNTIGYGSPIFWSICFIYEYMLSSWYAMIAYAVLLVVITIIFLLIWIVYHVIKPFGFFTGNAHKGSPFKNVMGIINMLDRKTKFTKVLQDYRDELIKIIMKLEIFKSLNVPTVPTEKFTIDNEDIFEEFVTAPVNREYINEDLTLELKDKYKEKNFYYIEAYKHNSHKKSANIYKTLQILTPSMDDAAISNVYITNAQELNNINFKYLINLNSIK